MDLNNYQKAVIKDVKDYLDAVMNTNGVHSAWREYWYRKGVIRESAALPTGIPTYCDDLDGVPNVCIKVPTGGGKTFLATASLKEIFERLPLGKTRFVMWLVPSDAILTQTIANLSNSAHPYRQKLNGDFAGCVNVYDKMQLLNAQNFKPTDVIDNLSVAVFCYASIRANPKSKDDKKIYQENGNLLAFAEMFKDKDLLIADTPETALLQVIRQMRPVVVVDESHNAKSELSLEMLKNLNPSFVLSMTATPTKRSNIISRVNARELKKENMVKLPVVVYNRPDRKSVIYDTVKLRGVLERNANAEYASGNRYIRPIALFQAQPKNSDDSTTFEKIKDKLIAIGISAEEIAIKTSNKDDLKGVDLMSRGCKIRYIITVNALKEGWDCPFAYVLASLANKTSRVDVEQIVGRILRQPYACSHRDKLLNMSYVLSCSADFQSTVKSVVEGLNGAGFSADDYRIAVSDDETHVAVYSEQSKFDDQLLQEVQDVNDKEDDLSDVSVEEIGTFEDEALDVVSKSLQSIDDLIVSAKKHGEEYDRHISESESVGFLDTGVSEMKVEKLQSEFADEAMKLELPQFFVQEEGGLFDDGKGLALLRDAALLDDFSLVSQDASVVFNPSLTGAVSVDISDKGEITPKCKLLSKSELEYFSSQLAGKSTDERLKNLIEIAASQLDARINFCVKKDIVAYINRVVAQLSPAVRDQLSLELLPSLVQCVKEKINSQARQYKRERFRTLLNENSVLCKNGYKLPMTIAPLEVLTHIDKSLYTGEYDDMNGDEIAVVQSIAAKENVKWWHRIKDRKGFCINGFLNHYPDFLILTKKGTVVLVEVKGSHLDGSDSQAKIELGQAWANAAGQNYKYFMVFLKDGDAVQGALKIDAFLNTIEKL